MLCVLGLVPAGQERVLVGTGDAVPCRFRLVTGAQPRRSGGTRLCSLRWCLHHIVPAVAMGCGRSSPGSMGCYRSGYLPCRCRYNSLGTSWYLRSGGGLCETLNRSIRLPSDSRVPTTPLRLPYARCSGRAGFLPPSKAAIHRLCSIGQSGLVFLFRCIMHERLVSLMYGPVPYQSSPYCVIFCKVRQLLAKQSKTSCPYDMRRSSC